MKVLVVVDVLAFGGVLEPIATNVLPNSIDDVRPLGCVDSQQPGKFAGELVLDWLGRKMHTHIHTQNLDVVL